MIRISIRNLSADLEFEIGGKPTVSRADIERVLGTAPIEIPGMSPAFVEGDLRALFDKVAEVFAAYAPKPAEELPRTEVQGDPIEPSKGEWVEGAPSYEHSAGPAPEKGRPEPLEAPQLRPITFQGNTFNLAFVGPHVLIPVARAFAFTGFKNAHHLGEAAQEKGEAFFVRMPIDPDAQRRSIMCVTLAGLDIAWSEARRRMNKRQITGQSEDTKLEEFTTLRNLIIDTGIQLQRELLGLADDPQKVMYASDEEISGLLNKTQLLNTLIAAGEAWTRDRLDRILVDQGILRADSLTWGKTELGNITQHAVREGFVKILSVRCERKENPGQDTHDAYVQRWKPYFTEKTVNYILSGPQGDASNWGLLRVYQLEASQTPLPVDRQVEPPAPDNSPSASDNK